MKGKEDMAVKCALAGGALGLLMGFLSAVLTYKEEGGGVLTIFNAVLEIMMWGLGLAMAGGSLGYVSMFFAERKLGLAPAVETGPDQIILKTSYLRGLQTETQKTCLDVSARVAAANQHLAAAEKEFADGAFAPFWDEIERAANQLAAYKNEVEHLQRNVSVYNAEAGELVRLGGDSVAPLVVPMSQLPDARPSAARFMSIVRKAQTNFEFAMIFEQRKTNQLLHTGFGTLGSAIHSLGESINASLDKLSQSMNNNTDRMLSYQDPLRHIVSKALTKEKKPADAEAAVKYLQRYDPKQD
jgi:hypothetical protein